MPGAGTLARGPIDPGFMDEVRATVPGRSRLECCIQCGTCGESCPSLADMDHTPRALFAINRAGLRDEVLASNTPFMCVSCYLCVVRCPQEVHITDVMCALKTLATRAGRAPRATAPDFSRTFVDNIRRYGRSFELGLVIRHYLRHDQLRLPAMAPMGIEMLLRRRIGLLPHRIADVRGLVAILDEAARLEGLRAHGAEAAGVPA